MTIGGQVLDEIEDVISYLEDSIQVVNYAEPNYLINTTTVHIKSNFWSNLDFIKVSLKCMIH